MSEIKRTDIQEVLDVQTNLVLKALGFPGDFVLDTSVEKLEETAQQVLSWCRSFPPEDRVLRIRSKACAALPRHAGSRPTAKKKDRNTVMRAAEAEARAAEVTIALNTNFKTGGTVTDKVFAVVGRRQEVVASDVSDALGITINQACAALYQLYRRKKIRRRKSVRPGKGCKPSTFVYLPREAA